MQQQMQQRERQAQQSITPQMESKYATLQAQIAKEGAAQRADPRIGQSLRSPEEQELLRTFSMARATPQGMGMQSQQLQQMQQPQMGGMQGLLEAGATGDSKTVGIGEMELAADATQRLLEQQGPQNPSWERITDPTIGGTTVGNVADVGNTAIGAPTAFELDRVAAPELAGVGAGAVERVSASNIAGPAGVTIDPFTGQTAEALQDIGPGTIAGPGELALDPVTGQATSAVGGVAPGEFGGSSFLGGPAISDYMNTAGTDAAVTQARQDYEVALNREKSRQAQVGAFGSRGTVEEAGLIAAQERNIAQIRGAGFDRAAQMMEADTGRRQQAGLQSQQLGFQGGMAGQALEAQRRESDASRAQQAALQGQQLGFQGQLQTQQLAQSGDIRGAELGLQASMQGQQLEAQRRSEEAARYQQAGLAGQQLQAQSGMQTQQLQQQASIQGAQNALNAAQSNQRVAMQSGSEQKQLEAARQIEEARLGLSAAQQTQQLGAQTGMQTQELGTQVAIQNAQNEMRSAEQNMQSALQTGSQQAQIDAQRQMSQSQMRLDAATRNQQAGLQSAGMGLDAQGQFREQQMDAAQQLADIGGMEQGATFNAAGQLQQMGGQQERAQMLQQAWDYEQWLRGQQGGADSLRLMNSMMPGGSQETLDRGPDRFGQILGAGTAVGGAYIGRDRSGSDVRVKENITYAGTKNGFNVYDFNYLGGDNRYRGVMAQEVMKQRPDAVESRNGVYWVDYGALGIQMEAV